MSLLGFDFWRDALGGTIDDAAVLNGALHHPVAGTRAVNARIDTSGAKIVVATVTHAAMKVLVFHGVVAVVAVHNP